jgi:hypothetical protein
MLGMVQLLGKSHPYRLPSDFEALPVILFVAQPG